MGKIKIEPFRMEYLEDYYNAFTEEITKYQWPDPFERLEDAKELLQSFLDEADVRNIGSMKLLRKFADDYEFIDQGIEKTTTDSGKELELQGFVLKAVK